MHQHFFQVDHRREDLQDQQGIAVPGADRSQVGRKTIFARGKPNVPTTADDTLFGFTSPGQKLLEAACYYVAEVGARA